MFCFSAQAVKSYKNVRLAAGHNACFFPTRGDEKIYKGNVAVLSFGRRTFGKNAAPAYKGAGAGTYCLGKGGKNMQFDKSETFLNLARGFAGESQAGMRYQLIAQQAMAQGYKTLADTIRAIAKNETNHARIFFEHIQKYAGSTDNINVNAGYPFHAGDLEENLRLASLDEREEEKRIYPAFAKTAEEEGFADIARSFRQIAVIESNHNVIFNYLYEAIKNGTLYKNETPMLWICSECGYMHTSTEAWNICPVCRQSQGYVELHIPFQKEKL